jgi:hypothetical protein
VPVEGALPERRLGAIHPWYFQFSLLKAGSGEVEQHLDPEP